MGATNAKERRSTGKDDVLGSVEIELTKLVRYLETFGRKSSIFVDVDRAGYIALRTLQDLGPSNLNALANALHLDSSTITRQVAVLESSGFVRREMDPVDRRSWTISLTMSGKQTMRNVEKARRVMIAELLYDWTPKELGDLARIMPKLNDSLVAKAKADRVQND
jgi:DNA-binding MarR family transcriptional regulator